MEIKKDFFCRVSKDGTTGRFYIRKLGGLDREIAMEVARHLGCRPDDLHRKTCGIVKSRGAKSATGDEYLSEKILRLKLTVAIEECQLVDDKDIGLG